MRKISQNIKYLLSQPSLISFYLISIKGSNISEQYTTHSSDVSAPGLGLFRHNNNLASFSPPMMESATNRETYKLTFSDADFSFRELASANLVGSRVKLYLVVVNNTHVIIGGAAPGQPLLQAEDITLGFDGIIDSRQYIVNPFENMSVFNIECSTPMGSLAMAAPTLVSRDSLSQLDPTDTAYDEVYQGSAGVTLLWGKMP